MLIQYLASIGNKERASQIAQGIADESITPKIELLNRIYDIVLNMNSLNSRDN